MSSIPVYKVPYWAKVAFFVFSVCLFVSLVSYQFKKRQFYNYLLSTYVLMPTQIVPIDLSDQTLLIGKDGGVMRFSEYGEQPILLNFWATWCPPCQEEIPSLDALARKMEGELSVVTASVDEDFADVQRYFGNSAPSFSLLWDKNKKLASYMGVTKYPETFLVLPGSKAVIKFDGPRDFGSPEAVAYLRKVIRSKGMP